MIDKRLDVRTPEQMYSNIFNSTSVESYLFHRWYATSRPSSVTAWRDNGCGNDGTDTSGADFIVTIEGRGEVPFEVKWLPVRGLATLKRDDLRSYAAEGAAIQLFENTGAPLTARAYPVLEDRMRRIEETPIRWGIVQPSTVRRLARESQWQPAPYLGGKMATRECPDDLCTAWYPLVAKDHGPS